MDSPRCNQCSYFRQHYTFDSRRIFRVYCGHCTFARPKHKRPDAPACENFVYNSVESSAFASKEYLSKELLKYVLELELLPQIENDPTILKQIK